MAARITALWQALFIGVQLASATAWRRRLITGSMVASFLSAVVVCLRWFGVHVPVTDEQLSEIGAGVVAVGGVLVSVLTVATSSDVGLSRPGTGDGGGVAGGAAAAPVAGAPGPEGGAGGGSVSIGVPGGSGGAGGGVTGSAGSLADPFRDHGA